MWALTLPDMEVGVRSSCWHCGHGCHVCASGMHGCTSFLGPWLDGEDCVNLPYIIRVGLGLSVMEAAQ